MFIINNNVVFEMLDFTYKLTKNLFQYVSSKYVENYIRKTLKLKMNKLSP